MNPGVLAGISIAINRHDNQTPNSSISELELAKALPPDLIDKGHLDCKHGGDHNWEPIIEWHKKYPGYKKRCSYCQKELFISYCFYGEQRRR